MESALEPFKADSFTRVGFFLATDASPGNLGAGLVTARRQAAFIYNAWFRPVALGIAISDVFVMFALQAFDFWCADGL